MEILVCLKQVPDDSVELHLKPGTQEVNLEGVTPVVNAFDTYALEMATRLKEAVGGSITAITIGPEGAKDAVKTCLAVGANQGCLITDPSFEGADTLGKSKILAAAIRKLEADAGKPFDLIFCGREATDKASGQVGPQLAEALGVGVVTDLVDIQQTDAGVQAKQETEEGYRLVDAPLPCVVTVNKPPYDPRYPTIKRKMAANRAEIPVLGEDAFPDIDTTRIGLKGSPTNIFKSFTPPQKGQGRMLEGADKNTCAELAAELLKKHII